jgi:molybdopterin converting factor small subunit
VAKVKLQVFSWLTTALGAKDRTSFVEVLEVQAGETVRHLFGRLAAEHQDFAKYVFDRDRQDLTGRVSVLFNDRVLELVQGLDTEIEDGDTITLIPAYAGG